MLTAVKWIVTNGKLGERCDIITERRLHANYRCYNVVIAIEKMYRKCVVGTWTVLQNYGNVTVVKWQLLERNNAKNGRSPVAAFTNMD